MRNGESKYILMKKFIVNATAAKITATNIYSSMARMSSNDECPSGNFGDSSQLTNWILDSGATCHMAPEVSDFIPGSLEDTGKHIEVEDRHHVIAKQKGQVQIKMCDGHGYPFINTYFWHQIYATGYFKPLH